MAHLLGKHSYWRPHRGKITNLLLNSDPLEEVAQFKYLEVTIQMTCPGPKK